MKISELLCNNDLNLRITSSSGSNYKVALYWKDEEAELKQGCFTRSLYGVGNTIGEAIKNLISEIMYTHKIKVNKNDIEDSCYINVASLYQ